MSFINSDMHKQAQAIEVTQQGQQNHITHKPVSTIYISRIYWNEKLNFHPHILVRNA